MRLVVDANVLFAALIRRNATFLMLFEDSLQLYAPQFIFDEFAIHKDELVKKTSQNPQDFENALLIISKRFQIVQTSEFASFAQAAGSFSPDPKDVPYLALALHLGPDVSIWSNDKRLKIQDKVPVISTAELIERLYRTDPYAPPAV